MFPNHPAQRLMFLAALIRLLNSCNKVTKSSDEGNLLGRTQDSSEPLLSDGSHGFISKKFLGIDCHMASTEKNYDKNHETAVKMLIDSQGHYDRYVNNNIDMPLRKTVITKRISRTSSRDGYIQWVGRFSGCLPIFEFDALDKLYKKENTRDQSPIYYNAQSNLGNYGETQYKRRELLNCNYLSVRARDNFPKVGKEKLFILYQEIATSEPRLLKYEIEVSGYEKIPKSEQIKILSTTSPKLLSPRLNGQMVVDKDGKFVGFADVALTGRDIKIQVVSALSPSLMKDLRDNYFGHENFRSEEQIPKERNPKLGRSNCKYNYLECELVEKKNN